MSSPPHTARWSAADYVTLVAICGVTVLAALLFRHSKDGVFAFVVQIATWLRGGPMPEVVTWPAWGYAWVVAWLPSFGWVIALQAALAALALGTLAARMRRAIPSQGTLIAVLCVFALPWHDLEVTLYPSAPASSLALLALLSLERTLARGSFRWALVAGILLGLAQNFRTEIVLLPTFLGIVLYALSRFVDLKIPTLRPMWIFIATAFLMQIPWAQFYHEHAGRYSLTESNFGHVLYVSLGSNLHNPWGIEANDQAAYKAVKDAGYSFSSLSEQGNKFLLSVALQKVKEHPSGLVGRTLQQLRNTLLAPFNWGEPRLDPAGTLHLDVLRQELKSRLGVGVNVLKLREQRNRGLAEQAEKDAPAILALIYQTVMTAVGSAVLALGILGMGLVLFRPEMRPATPLLWILGATASYKLVQNTLLFYQVNYLNGAYPLFIPFVAVSVTFIRNIWGRPKGVKLASPP
jgi:4-amino-4-deoxy-L-arabinose transferase-like glycosyltransferase